MLPPLLMSSPVELRMRGDMSLPRPFFIGNNLDYYLSRFPSPRTSPLEPSAPFADFSTTNSEYGHDLKLPTLPPMGSPRRVVAIA